MEREQLLYAGLIAVIVTTAVVFFQLFVFGNTAPSDETVEDFPVVANGSQYEILKPVKDQPVYQFAYTESEFSGYKTTYPMFREQLSVSNGRPDIYSPGVNKRGKLLFFYDNDFVQELGRPYIAVVPSNQFATKPNYEYTGAVEENNVNEQVEGVFSATVGLNEITDKYDDGVQILVGVRNMNGKVTSGFTVYYPEKAFNVL